MALRPCLDCGEPSPNARCPRDERLYERKRHNRQYDSPAWRRLRDQMLAEHRRKYGDRCPQAGWHDADATNPLTVDHLVPLARGGALLLRSNLRVVCRRHNSEKASRPS